VALVAADQRKNPMAITQLTLTRSTSHPDKIRKSE
jgi:hypothetical protein